MADVYINRQKAMEDGFTVTQCLHMFGLSRSGYYAWLDRRKDKSGKYAEKRRALEELQEKFRQIMRKLGFVPGKRAFRTHMWRDHGISISVKQCRRIMKTMNIIANRPKKDAYKHQATHDHECASPENAVKQDFYIGPRKVILTDITYLYYGRCRTPIYLCAFKDAYTKEILGYAVQSRMTVDLVKAAYAEMMKKHEQELHGAGCVIHSDQGSQYLSTSFKKILSDDEFIHSVSGRGNSQDNAPMESFFGRMKCEILDLIALCPDADTVKEMIAGYMNAYNNERYQYALAGLTPSEYYIYIVTGIYPLDNYYGVTAAKLMSVGELVKARLDATAKNARKARKASAKRRESKRQADKSPAMIVIRDQNILRREISRWTQSMEQAHQQLSHLGYILEKTKQAVAFLTTAPSNLLAELNTPQKWQKYPELDYIYDMAGLF